MTSLQKVNSKQPGNYFTFTVNDVLEITMHNILVVDSSIYQKTIAKIFVNAGYNIEVCESAFDAMSKLKAYDFDLIVSEVELPGDNAFALYNYINKNYPYIPTIMTTDKNIDDFFEQIFVMGIGNVIFKPVKRDELLNLTEKIITKENIFGLENYMKDISEIKKIRVTSSKQIQKAINLIMDQIEEWGFKIENKIILSLVLNEMAINAVYHSHGYTKEKEKRVSIKLKEGEFVDMFFVKSKSSYGISINDYNGKLTKTRILDSINKVIVQNQLITEAVETGKEISGMVSETGRGIDLVRKLCGEYFFIIKRNVRTEIILIFDLSFAYDTDNYSSLKIIEDLT